MKNKTIEEFIRHNNSKFDKPFPTKDNVWDKIQVELNASKKASRGVWWKPLSGIAAAVILGLIAVWGLQQYKHLTALSSEMANSVHFYENAEIRLIKNISNQNLSISPDIRHDLNELDETQKLLKNAFRHAPESKRDWIYSALIESYELKINLLEQIIYFDHLEQNKKQYDETAL